MSRIIGVVDSFQTEAHKKQMEEIGSRYGFTFRYYKDDEEAMQSIADCEILYSHSDPAVLKAAKNLKWFCCDFAGVDKYLSDDVYCNADCILTNSSGAYGTTIAEHLVMVALMLLRRMPEYEQIVKARRWDNLDSIRSIHGLHITVLGTGDIGTNFARRAKAMGAAKVVGVRRSQGDFDKSAYDEMYTIDRLDEILPQTEMLVMCLPSTPATVGILSRERIALLRKDAYVINIGRGTAIDQDALMEALNADKIAGAALDVMMPEPLPVDHPLWETKNTILTPHISGNMTLGYTCDLDVNMFCEDLINYAEGKPLQHVVDRKRGY